MGTLPKHLRRVVGVLGSEPSAAREKAAKLGSEMHERPIKMAETNRKRCDWVGEDPVYILHHDREWGLPVRDSRALWEHLVLDGFQAGLSWLTVLRKRDAFRQA